MDTIVVSMFMTLSLAGFCHYYGFTTYLYNWIQKVYLFVNLAQMTMESIATTNNNKASFTVNDTDCSANILYERLGTQYIMLVPYNRSQVARMLDLKAELYHNNGHVIDITQQPGIPYLVDPQDLGGKIIRITNQESGKYHDYHKAPLYAPELTELE